MEPLGLSSAALRSKLDRSNFGSAALVATQERNARNLEMNKLRLVAKIRFYTEAVDFSNPAPKGAPYLPLLADVGKFDFAPIV